MKNYDYKSKMNRNKKRYAKQIAGVAIATTFALSTPIAPSVLSESGFKNVLSSSVVHAATENLIEVATENEPRIFSSNFYNRTEYYAGLHIDFPDAENLDYKVTWKIPDVLATGLDNPDHVDHMKRYTSLSGSYLDENGDRVSSNDVHDAKYVTINPSNQTVEYDLSALLEEHNLRLNDSINGTPSLLAGTEIVTDLRDVPEGEHLIKFAVTSGSANPDDVDGAYEFVYEVDYSKDQGDDPEEPEEPECIGYT